MEATEENKVKIIEIVTISKLTPIFKNGEEANAIEMVNFNFANGDECGYNLIAGKGLYQIGSKASYIQPDYCLSEISLFESFTAPGGNPNKTRLGKMNRIRALKFNFSLENTTDAIYSFGVLMPFEEVKSYLNISDVEMYEKDLAELLGVTKYEEPEKSGSGISLNTWPSFLYHTDEENLMNRVSQLKYAISNEQTFGVSIKRDGSSHTTYIKKNDGVYKVGVCSRNLEKSMEQTYTNKWTDPVTKSEYTRYIQPETKIKGWFNNETQVFFSDDEISEQGFKEAVTEVHDSWVDLAHSSGLIKSAVEYCKEHDLELAFRGEIVGTGLRGSGNKLNPDANSKQTLILFGVDDLSKGHAERINYSSEHNLVALSDLFEMQYTDVHIIKPTTYEELIAFCDNMIQEEEIQGRIIEGVVIRSHFTNDISLKYMNAMYDSKK
jgi:hypothetical protein